MSATFPTVKQWTRNEYYAAGEAGVFDGERVELINGEILVMSPMSARHAATIAMLDEAFRQHLSAEFHIRIQLPLTLDRLSEPEPDAAIVAGPIADFVDQHPASAVLVIEVSLSTLDFDRAAKLSLYASHGIPEYWIVNLRDNQLEVHRTPADGAYSETLSFDRDGVIRPLFQTELAIPVSELLPRDARS